MTTTAHLSLLQLVAAALQALPSVPAASVYVERAAAIDKDECPAINLAPGDNRFENFGADTIGCDLLRAAMPFTVRIHTRGDPHTQQADAAIGDVNAALMADPSLGGYAMRLRLSSSRPTQAQADSTAGVYELGYEATVVVASNNLALQPL